jgi:hypothetical protein
LIDFCKKVADYNPSDTMAINKDIAQKLLTIKQVKSVLQTATQNSISSQQIQTEPSKY